LKSHCQDTVGNELPECVAANLNEICDRRQRRGFRSGITLIFAPLFADSADSEVHIVCILKVTAPSAKEAIFPFETPEFINTNATRPNASEDQIPQRQQLEISNIASQRVAAQMSQSCSYS
jgi:hypothetical protein